MAEASIPVDLFNPGQVFACLGFVEAAEELLGGAEGAFDWSDPNDVRFWLRAHSQESPVVRVLRFLAEATVSGEVPKDSPNLVAWKNAWGRLRTCPREEGYPFPDPVSPATLVCVVNDEQHRLSIEHWAMQPSVTT